MSRKLEIELRAGDGWGSLVGLPEAGLLVGSAEGVDVRVPAEHGLLPEHFFVSPTDSGCELRLADGAPGARLDGRKEFAGGPLGFDSELLVGRITLRVKRERSVSEAHRPWWILAGCLCLCIGLLRGFGSGATPIGETPPARDFPLIERQERCAASSERVLAEARRAEAESVLLAESAQLFPLDRLRELHAAHRALTCFEGAGRVADVQRLRVRTAALEAGLLARLQDNHFLVRLSLRRASWSRVMDIVEEQRGLCQLAGEPARQYAGWLEGVARYARAQLRKAG